MKNFVAWWKGKGSLIVLCGLIFVVTWWCSGCAIEGGKDVIWRDQRVAGECIAPTLHNTLYGGRYEGVRYIYTCADGTMIEVGHPIPGAKVPR